MTGRRASIAAPGTGGRQVMRGLLSATSSVPRGLLVCASQHGPRLRSGQPVLIEAGIILVVGPLLESQH